MQENLHYKPGADFPDYSSGGLPNTSTFPTGLPENNGIFGGINWGDSGMPPIANDPHLQQDAVDNTAVGKIFIPA
jgi:hypothetical protein